MGDWKKSHPGSINERKNGTNANSVLMTSQDGIKGRPAAAFRLTGHQEVKLNEYNDGSGAAPQSDRSQGSNRTPRSIKSATEKHELDHIEEENHPAGLGKRMDIKSPNGT